MRSIGWFVVLAVCSLSLAPVEAVANEHEKASANPKHAKMVSLEAILPSFGKFAAPGVIPVPRKKNPDDRTAIIFPGPVGLKVARQLPDGSFDASMSKEDNFTQGSVSRLRVRRTLADKSVETFYPTLEVAPATQKTKTFLHHSSVPVSFSAEDFAQATAGNLVVKVIYLPDPQFQDFRTIVGAEEVVSTRLEPGIDPLEEAKRRGTILAIVRMGNIDLEKGREIGTERASPEDGSGER